ncbi:hypothetical protein ACVWZM_004110 [Bradyrhizobium sp. USDA 4501]
MVAFLEKLAPTVKPAARFLPFGSAFAVIRPYGEVDPGSTG